MFEMTKHTKKYLGVALFFLGMAVLGVLAYEFTPKYTAHKSTEIPMTQTLNATTNQTEAIAIFSGGCFWCSENHFEKLEGVTEVISGYTGGSEEDPTYKEVSSGTTGHKEGVLVKYNPQVVSYNELVDHFWMHVNPTDSGGQFYDRGSQYTTAIYYLDDAQKDIATKNKKALSEAGIYESPIVTPILPARDFYPAEDYHQDYSKKNPLRYKYYTDGSGRYQFVESVWGEED